MNKPLPGGGENMSKRIRSHSGRQGLIWMLAWWRISGPVVWPASFRMLRLRGGYGMQFAEL